MPCARELRRGDREIHRGRLLFSSIYEKLIQKDCKVVDKIFFCDIINYGIVSTEKKSGFLIMEELWQNYL